MRGNPHVLSYYQIAFPEHSALRDSASQDNVFTRVGAAGPSQLLLAPIFLWGKKTPKIIGVFQSSK